MLIESLIKRAKGTKITLDGIVYAFLPNDKGQHVAEVDNDTHAAQLLAIKEGFRRADGVIVQDAADIEAPDGFFFLIRGPQDLTALFQWLHIIPDFEDHEAFEQTMLIDKISFGDANLGGYQLPSPEELAKWTPPAREPSPRVSADKFATGDLVHGSSTGTEAGADTGDASGASTGGAGVGGAGTDSSDDEEAGEESDAEDDEQAVKFEDGQPLSALMPAADPAPAPSTTPATDPEADREKLADEYAGLFGHRPNGKWKADKIAAAIAEKKAQG